MFAAYNRSNNQLITFAETRSLLIAECTLAGMSRSDYVIKSTVPEPESAPIDIEILDDILNDQLFSLRNH